MVKIRQVSMAFKRSCTGSNTTLTANGDPSASFAWYDAPSGGNLLASTAEYTTSYLTSNTPFFIQQTVSGNTSSRKEEMIFINQIPSPNIPTNLSTTPSTICFGESSNLSATVDVDNDQVVAWYDAPSGGSLLGTAPSGSPFTVSPITTTILLESKTVVLRNGWKKTELDLDPYPVGFYELQIIWNQRPRTYRIIKVDK